MSDVKQYYNDFYREHFLDLDEAGNDFRKIASLWPEVNPPARVLDIGCGAGSVSSGLVEMGYEVFGLDLQEEAIRRAQARGLIAQVYDISQGLPFKNESLDIVLALDILEHLFLPKALLAEAHRVLKRNGFLIISLPLHFNLRERVRILFGKGIVDLKTISLDKKRVISPWNFDHIRFFMLRQALEMVKLVGFEVEQREYSGVHFPIRFASRLLSNKYTIRLAPHLLAEEVKMRLGKA